MRSRPKHKKPGLQPRLRYEVSTVVACSLDKTGSNSCPSSAVFAVTRSDASRSPSEVTLTQSNIIKNSSNAYVMTRPDTRKNSPTIKVKEITSQS